MSQKDGGLFASLGTMLSVLSLLFYCAGFITIEIRLNDYDGRLMAVEEVVSALKQHQEVPSTKQGTVFSFST